MPGSIQIIGNGLAAVWFAVAALNAATASVAGGAKRGHDGTGLVMWGSYLVALLSLNVQVSPFGTLAPIIQYAGVGLTGAAILVRITLATARALGLGGRAMPVCHALFCVGLSAASGNMIALVTVIVATSAATAVAFSHVRRGDQNDG